MSEIGEVFAALKEKRRAKKLSNIEHSTYMLVEKGFDIDIRNGGVHLIVKQGIYISDFWPSTGKFIFRGINKKGRGVKRLVAEFNKLNKHDVRQLPVELICLSCLATQSSKGVIENNNACVACGASIDPYNLSDIEV